MGSTSAHEKPLLILDLDETLIHATENDIYQSAAFQVGPYTVYKRPNLDSFLRAVAEHFELAVWSSAGEDYVNQIAAELAGTGINWSFVWSRSRCTQRLDKDTLQYVFVKDLKKVKRLGYDLARVLVVDDTPEKLSRNYGNVVYVSEFVGDEDDQELLLLSDYLISIRESVDYRRLEKRGWKRRNP